MLDVVFSSLLNSKRPALNRITNDHLITFDYLQFHIQLVTLVVQLLAAASWVLFSTLSIESPRSRIKRCQVRFWRPETCHCLTCSSTDLIYSLILLSTNSSRLFSSPFHLNLDLLPSFTEVNMEGCGEFKLDRISLRIQST